MKMTTKEITLKVELAEIDPLDYRDQTDQVQYNLYSILHTLSELVENIAECGDPMHWPEGALVNAARGLLNIEAARESYLAERYNKALVEASVASWDILRVPANSISFLMVRHLLERFVCTVPYLKGNTGFYSVPA